jgi:two-component system C4-dicarboxylate transport response regulator DctD
MTPPHRASIVIVEDHVSLLGALLFALQADGFDVHAYDRAGPVLAAPPAADCMVVDMRLPDMDGLTLIARLREKGIWIPAILTTTNPDRRTRRTADDMGVLIVEKPLITGELRTLIDDLVAADTFRR